MQITGIKIRNFKAFQDFELTDITPLTVFIGRNGTGKSTLFEVFWFLKMCLESNSKPAFDKLGGYKNVISKGHEDENIRIELEFDTDYSYVAEFTASLTVREFLNHRSPFLEQEIKSPIKWDNHLSVKIIHPSSYPEQIPVVEAIRRFSFSDFDDNSIKGIPLAYDVTTDVSPDGANLMVVAHNLYEKHPDRFKIIVERMKRHIPGISDIEMKKTEDERVIMKINDGAFKDAILSKYASDGTMRLFAYLCMFANPSPPSLLCVEEPERQIANDIMPYFAEYLYEYSENGQIFVASHSAEMLNYINLEDAVILTKKDGFATASHLKDNPDVVEAIEYGDKLGRMWNQGFFD